MFTHLKIIDEQSLATAIPKGRGKWHYLWAQVFNLINIDRTDIFLRAYIIHYVQTILSFLMVFYFSKVFIRNIFVEISQNTLNYLGYWSTIVWLTMFSTASEYYHQVWIMWYSINYQITLPLTLLLTALTFSLLFESCSAIAKTVKTILIIFIGYTILRIHAMEFIYYLMYMFVLIIVYFDRIITLAKRYFYLSLPLAAIIVYGAFQFIEYINTFAYRKSPILNYLSFEKLPKLFEDMAYQGQIIISNYNRAYTTINELIVISLYCLAVLMLIIILRHFKKYPIEINIRLVWFLGITSLFIFIPVFKYTAGLASLLTYTTISYRFYFSSLLFLVVPIFIYYILKIYHIRNIWIMNGLIASLLLVIFVYSRFDSGQSQNYYKNIQSIKNAFYKERVGFNLNQQQIQKIGELLNYYESNNKTGKPIFYYARDDIAFVIKFIYQKPVLYTRRGTWDYQKSYRKHHDPHTYPVLFTVPKGFPTYTRFK